MTDLVLESVRTGVLLLIIFYLWKAGRDHAELSRKGWRLILGGFLLLFFGSVLDITDNFESLNRFVVVGDTETQAYLEKMVGFLGGFMLLAIGLIRWLPTITSVEEISSLAEELSRANKQLAAGNTELQSEIGQRERA